VLANGAGLAWMLVTGAAKAIQRLRLQLNRGGRGADT